MINAVGREIPDEILRQTGKEPFQGNHYKEGVPFRRYAPIIRPVMDNRHSKLVADIHEALVKCKAHIGMTVSFHHHFREGDLVVNMVMEEIHKMGFKNITLAATSLGKAHDPLVPMLETAPSPPSRRPASAARSAKRSPAASSRASRSCAATAAA